MHGQDIQHNTPSYALCAETFSEVLRSYTRIKQQSPLTASNHDPEALNDRLTPQGIHFVCDVELATESAIGQNKTLQAAWFDLLLGNSVEKQLKIEVTARSGREYVRRELAPHLYFKTTRQRRVDG